MSITINVHKKLHIIDDFFDKLIDVPKENKEIDTTKYFHCFDEGSINNVIPSNNNDQISSYNEVSTSYVFDSVLDTAIRVSNEDILFEKKSNDHDLQSSHIYSTVHTNFDNTTDVDNSVVKYLNIHEFDNKKYKKKRLGNIVFSVLLNIGGNWFD